MHMKVKYKKKEGEKDMNEKIIDILESNEELMKFGIHYPLSQENVRNNISLLLESACLYLTETNGCITEQSYRGYLQQIIMFYYSGGTIDFHKVNCYHLIQDKQSGIPWHLCSLMHFDTMQEEQLTILTLQRIVYSDALISILCISG